MAVCWLWCLFLDLFSTRKKLQTRSAGISKIVFFFCFLFSIDFWVFSATTTYHLKPWIWGLFFVSEASLVFSCFSCFSVGKKVKTLIFSFFLKKNLNMGSFWVNFVPIFGSKTMLKRCKCSRFQCFWDFLVLSRFWANFWPNFRPEKNWKSIFWILKKMFSQFSFFHLFWSFLGHILEPFGALFGHFFETFVRSVF